MTITVTATNLSVARPIKLSLIDNSGAHVILTVAIEGRPPISHVFDFDTGDVNVPLDIAPGKYSCALVVQAFKHGALNGMYDCELQLNRKQAGKAKGSIQPPDPADVGFGQFTLTVT